MNVAVQGTKNFKDYSVFMRAMGVALSSCDDGEFNVYTVGPAVVNTYTSEFCNVSEAGLKQRGIKVRFFRVPPSYVAENIENFQYVALLSTPKERPSFLINTAEENGVENAIFRY